MQMHCKHKICPVAEVEQKVMPAFRTPRQNPEEDVNQHLRRVEHVVRPRRASTPKGGKDDIKEKDDERNFVQKFGSSWSSEPSQYLAPSRNQFLFSLFDSLSEGGGERRDRPVGLSDQVLEVKCQSQVLLVDPPCFVREALSKLQSSSNRKKLIPQSSLQFAERAPPSRRPGRRPRRGPRGHTRFWSISGDHATGPLRRLSG
mmetsp:Transcript_14033/g.28084  ORF Transcript_14033/g.28084 Transcript_14033/m.28084 type:complete len:202 (+) Transcript_14033:1608-2213(+)